MIIFYLFSLLFLFLIVYSWRSIRRGQKTAKFTYTWGFIMGAFVYEDVFAFSVYGLIASLATIFLDHWKFGLFFFLIFWFVRSAGEALYFFLQQFIVPKHYPHFVDDHFVAIRYIFGDISYQQCLIIMQIMFQVICMLSLSALIALIYNWPTI